MKKLISALCALAMVMVTYTPAQARFKGSQGPAGAQRPTSDAIVLQWNEIAVTTIGAQPPFLVILKKPQQIFGPRERAGMGREDPVGASLHDAVTAICAAGRPS